MIIPLSEAGRKDPQFYILIVHFQSDSIVTAAEKGANKSAGSIAASYQQTGKTEFGFSAVSKC